MRAFFVMAHIQGGARDQPRLLPVSLAALAPDYHLARVIDATDQTEAGETMDRRAIKTALEQSTSSRGDNLASQEPMQTLKIV